MHVLCLKDTISSALRERLGALVVDESPGVEIDRVYRVYGIEFVDGGVWLDILDDGGSHLFIVPMDLFEIVDPELSPSWVAIPGNRGSLWIAPPSFGLDAFMDRLSDGEPAIEDDFVAAIRRVEMDRPRTRIPRPHERSRNRHGDPVWSSKRLVWSLRWLAAAPDAALRAVPPDIDVPSEIAKDVHHWADITLGQDAVEPEVGERLQSILAVFDEMTVDPLEWTTDEFAEGSRWGEQRARASEALRLLGADLIDDGLIGNV